MTNAKSLCGVAVVALVSFSAVGAEGPPPLVIDEDNWPGKDSPIRRSIEISTTSLSGYGITLGSKIWGDTKWSLKVPLSESDEIGIGTLRIEVFPTVAEAHSALAQYRRMIQGVPGPPWLSAEEFPSADVGFGRLIEDVSRSGGVYGDAWSVTYARANVIIRLEAPVSFALELAGKIDEDIQRAPVWTEGEPEPTLALSEDMTEFLLSDTAVDVGTWGGVKAQVAAP